MTDAGVALKELGVTDWVLHGIPTNETEFNAMFRKVTGKDEYDIAIEDSDPANFGVTWEQVSAKMDAMVAAEPLRLLREERNAKLAETDWWVLPDRTATQAQLESTVRNLANVAENTAAAQGRIMDTDYAAETANLTKAQILQQAATSVLAQANAQPQSVLSLLQ